jgi:hypothetical protein
MISAVSTKLASFKNRQVFFGSLLGWLLISLALAGCGKDNKADSAIFSVLPSTPFVINAPSIMPSGLPLSPPWFSFRVSASNPTDTVFTILALSLNINGLDQTGSATINKVTFTPTDFTVAIPVGTTVYNCTFTHFGEFASQVVDQPLSLGGDTFSNNGVTCLRGAVFYAANNPAGPSGHSFTYSVRTEAQGWFGTYDVPTDRFDTFFSFSTR